MKKTMMIMMIVFVALVAIQGTLLAKTVEGTVEAVNLDGKQLDVATVTGITSVTYDDKTLWPMDVTDPKMLEGEMVSVLVDDVTDVATSVKAMAKQVAPVAKPEVAEEAKM